MNFILSKKQSVTLGLSVTIRLSVTLRLSITLRLSVTLRLSITLRLSVTLRLSITLRLSVTLRLSCETGSTFHNTYHKKREEGINYASHHCYKIKYVPGLAKIILQ